ncbi:hypothetical protein A2841_03715 [Candidatus Kaiserbacteria bacterium RIFCSPHIGHO2_01_FULL_48_10]|uniref:PKD domain-containing protein n=1 Tax=Candidatus Kaiserbacteria bacterium RIFCSPHIGHO2_01_FULL_48_10 TaxID=1798476 RepID=A0A1F6C3N4_9BACT|nr:MAG: hypothetical protein A2841_03715 [Candidatus Kaiserbacteria bacterium RIFCSPHIGHO2_01_FULL_48_10]
MRRLLAIACLFLAPLSAGAAILPSLYNIELEVMPEHPKTGEVVTITVHDPSATGETAYIWTINGSGVEQGVGRTTITTTAGAIGSAQTIAVQAIEMGETKGQAVTVIVPAEVDIVWEGRTKTPPFYAGLPLTTGMSQISAVAVPYMIRSGSRISSNNILYTWSIDGNKLSSQSGYGKSSVTITPPRFAQAFQLSVRAETSDGAVVAEKSRTIQPVSPAIALYERTPLAGIIFTKEIGTVFPLAEGEATLVAFPLFASTAGILSYEWQLDGKSFELDPEAPESATFKKSGSGSATHTVTFSFDDASKFLEHAERSFRLVF